MFDIGFAELVLLAIVGLIVIGPEQLPGTIRTLSVWLNKLRRSYNDIRLEVQQELHNESVLNDLRETGALMEKEADKMHGYLEKELRISEKLTQEQTVNETKDVHTRSQDDD